MELETHLKLRTPLVWVTCDEAPRVMARLAKHSTRPLYRLDPVEGLCRFVDGAWKRALVEDAEGNIGGTGELAVALGVVTREHATLVLTESHKSAPQLTAYLSSTVERYQQAVRLDDEGASAAQIVLVSHDDTIPPELRRTCGRIELGLPDAGEIAEVLTGLAAAAAAEVPGGDQLVRLCRAASGMSESELTTAALDCLRRLGCLEAADLNRAKLDVLKAGGLLSVRTPRAGLEAIGGLDRAKALVEGIAYIWANPEQTRAMDVEPLRRVLMVGLPGTGKSALAEAAAAALGLDLAKGGVGNVMNKYIGESEANMRRMWAQLKALAPVVFWIDEFGRDMSGGTSSNETDGGTTDRVHGEFLSGLQDLPDDIFLIGAANRVDHLPPEMTRADRFDKVMFIGFPTDLEREDIFRIHLGARAAEHDLAKLAGATPRFTGAEIKALVREVRFDLAVNEHRAPTTDDYMVAAPCLRGRVWSRHRKDVVTMYARARDEWEWASAAQEAEADEVLSAAKSAPVHAPA